MRRFGDLCGPEETHPAADQLGVQQGPSRVESRTLGISAGEAGGDIRNDERSHGDQSRLESDGQVGCVVAQIAGELQRRSGALHEHDAGSPGDGAIHQWDALVDEGLPHPVGAAAVGDVDRLDPGRSRGWSVVDEEVLDPDEQRPRLVARCAETVRDHVERRPTESDAQTAQQKLHPRGICRNLQAAVPSELQCALVAPEQRNARIQSRERLRGHRHSPILEKPGMPWRR